MRVANNVVYTWGQVQWPNGAFQGPGSLGPDPGKLWPRTPICLELLMFDIGVCCILYDQGGTGSGTICNPGNTDLTGYWQFHTQKFKCWW